ncbi:MAG: hypothetical protein M0T82_03395 [Desulfobacteraceae bacterium]|nr:hypothetical protein [Desulfobacteraceae bacterium]
MTEHISGNAEQGIPASGIIDKMLLNNAADIPDHTKSKSYLKIHINIAEPCKVISKILLW